MDLTKEQIDKINAECPHEQGIFTEPYGIPFRIKEPVIYIRYETGGVSGGSCWDESDPRPYSLSEFPEFKVLDMVIKEVNPNISYLKYKEIEELIHSNEETEWEYYGNSTDYTIKFVILSELLDTLKD